MKGEKQIRHKHRHSTFKFLKFKFGLIFITEPFAKPRKTFSPASETHRWWSYLGLRSTWGFYVFHSKVKILPRQRVVHQKRQQQQVRSRVQVLLKQRNWPVEESMGGNKGRNYLLAEGGKKKTGIAMDLNHWKNCSTSQNSAIRNEWLKNKNPTSLKKSIKSRNINTDWVESTLSPGRPTPRRQTPRYKRSWTAPKAGTPAKEKNEVKINDFFSTYYCSNAMNAKVANLAVGTPLAKKGAERTGAWIGREDLFVSGGEWNKKAKEMERLQDQQFNKKKSGEAADRWEWGLTQWELKWNQKKHLTLKNTKKSKKKQKAKKNPRGLFWRLLLIIKK